MAEVLGGELQAAITYLEGAIRESNEIMPECTPALQAELIEQKVYFEIALVALERQAPKKVIPNKKIPGLCKCPVCKTELCNDDEDLHFCPTCGQALQVL